MSTERFIEPEVAQALESVQEELRAEQRALESLPREHRELQERLEKLQTERTQLRSELEALKKRPPKSSARLPERLEPPFELRPWRSRWLSFREVVPALILVGCLLYLSQERSPVLAGLLCLIPLVWAMQPIFELAAKRPRWRFGESSLEAHAEQGPPVIVPYAEVLDVEVQATLRQHRRGVGSVVIQCKPKPGEEGPGQLLFLSDVPEPERLAEWIRSKRSGVG